VYERSDERPATPYRLFVRTVDAYVETGVRLAADLGVAAWTFDLGSWGWCGQGSNEATALADLASLLVMSPSKLHVAERIHGDELAFARDHIAASEAERAATLAILSDARHGVRELVEACRQRSSISTTRRESCLRGRGGARSGRWCGM